LTQLMTAYVLLDDIRKNKLSLGESVTVPEAATQVDGARYFSRRGSGQRRHPVAGHAAGVGQRCDADLGDIHRCSEAAFVARMNSMASGSA